MSYDPGCFTREEAEAVIEWANADQGTARYRAAENKLAWLLIPPERAEAIFNCLHDAGSIVPVCEDCAGKCQEGWDDLVLIHKDHAIGKNIPYAEPPEDDPLFGKAVLVRRRDMP